MKPLKRRPFTRTCRYCRKNFKARGAAKVCFKAVCRERLRVESNAMKLVAYHRGRAAEAANTTVASEPSEAGHWKTAPKVEHPFAIITRTRSPFCGCVLEHLAHDEVATLEQAEAAAAMVVARYGYARIERWASVFVVAPRPEVIAEFTREDVTVEGRADALPTAARVVLNERRRIAR